jgi:predicted alpha/beta-fold hydrolase
VAATSAGTKPWRPGALRCERASFRSVTELHDRIYPLAGYASRDAYYEASNPMAVAEGVATPLLVINAADDPVCSVKNLHPHLRLLQQLPRLTLALTQHGGHCGFFDGPLALRCWADRLLGEYLRTVHALTA